MKQAFTEIKTQKNAFNFIIVLGVVMLISIILLSPIKQDLTYHNFSDVSTFLNVNNFWNVVSNLPFLMVSLFGICNLKLMAKNKLQYLVFFIGVLFTAIGSSYYHLNPNSYTLIFDRLPMTIVFMALMSIIVSEYLDSKIGERLLFPLLLLGLTSVLYWVFSGNLALYIFVQFYPMLVIPVILISFKSRYTHVYGYWLLLLFYIVAKLCEYFDSEIYSVLKVISGHSLKHILSALGLYVLFLTFIKRRDIKLMN